MEDGNMEGVVWMHLFTRIRTTRVTKGGGSIIFITTDLAQIQANLNSQDDQITKEIDHVVIRIEHEEVVGRAPIHKSYWLY
jgi:hypothetical protein